MYSVWQVPQLYSVPWKCSSPLRQSGHFLALGLTPIYPQISRWTQAFHALTDSSPVVVVGSATIVVQTLSFSV